MSILTLGKVIASIAGLAICLAFSVLPVQASQLVMMPASVVTMPGETFSVVVSLIPENEASREAVLLIAYNPNVMEIKSFDLAEGWSQVAGAANSHNATTGQITKTITRDQAVTSPVTIGKMTFTATALGAGSVAYALGSAVLDESGKNILNFMDHTSVMVLSQADYDAMYADPVHVETDSHHETNEETTLEADEEAPEEAPVAIDSACESGWIEICHNPGGADQHEYCVAEEGKDAHLAHGDSLGKCALFYPEGESLFDIETGPPSAALISNGSGTAGRIAAISLIVFFCVSLLVGFRLLSNYRVKKLARSLGVTIDHKK